jgi:uncharacterized glyoxalase superfamily protein PhnB
MPESPPMLLSNQVEDVDATVERALKRGGKLVLTVETHFWGDRICAGFRTAGHMWTAQI